MRDRTMGDREADGPGPPDPKSAAGAALAGLLSDLRLDARVSGGEIRIVGDDPVVESRFRPGAASAAALLAHAVGVAGVWRARGGEGQDLSIDLRRAVVPGLRTSSHVTQNGAALAYGRNPAETENFFLTADGRRVYVLRSGNYPSSLIGLIGLLGCENSSAGLRNSIARWRGDELEDALAERKVVGVLARTRGEWLAHPQGQWLAAQPPVSVRKIGEAPHRAFRPAERPLSGLRVLDVAHVLAGPTCAKLLAEQGADVLHISRPSRPDDVRATLDTGLGKRSAYLDLDAPDDARRLDGLLESTDVFVESFRPGAMEARGLGPEQLGVRRPGIINVSVSAYGAGGPWRGRIGYELVGQAVSGLAIAEGDLEAPRVAPTFTLNDYLAGYLAAAGVTAALLRQAREGGSYSVEVSLARCSMWLQDLGPLPESLWPPKEAGPLPAVRASDLMETPSVYGLLRHPRPLVDYAATPGFWSLPPEPAGASPAAWSDAESLISD